MSEPNHSDIMHAIGVLEGKMDSVLRAQAETQKHILAVEEKANKNALSSARLWSVVGLGTGGGAVAGWLSKFIGNGG